MTRNLSQLAAVFAVALGALGAACIEDPATTMECTGCIDADGNCVDGNADDACGHSGGACGACLANARCAEHVCVAEPRCGPDNCDGCCDGDVCRDGVDDDACGVAGAACGDCGAIAGCLGGACVQRCGPDTCAGCCVDEFTCETGEDDRLCGRGGESCFTCSVGSSCMAGGCVWDSCSEICGGCCDGDVCHDGDSVAACGTDGDACITCGPSSVCNAGVCELDPTSRWDIVVMSAEVEETRADSEHWDPFGGLPDLYAKVWVDDEVEEIEGQTEVVEDSLVPTWSQVVLRDVPGRLLGGVHFSLYDDDAGSEDDWAGWCVDVAPIPEELRTLRCERDEESQRAGWTVHYYIRAH